MRGEVGRRLLAVFVLVGALAQSPMPVATAQEPVPRPSLATPPAGLRGHPLWDSYYELAPFGYEEQELFVSGTARNAAGTAAPYTTRMIVTRPSAPARFNGVVLLDWVNVTAQFENAVDTMLTREMLMREGFAFVHVSAQAAGLCCLPGLTPQMWDPVRYAALDHPGDDWSFDMFTQIARAFEVPPPDGEIDPMGSVGVAAVSAVLAAGQSQSGIRLHDYVRDWLPAHPSAVGVIDGVLVHGDIGKGKAFGPSPPVPVLQLLSDVEAVDDGIDPATLHPNHRLWEVAGTSHSDLFIGYQSVFGHGPRVLADAPPVSAARFQEIIDTAGNYGERVDPLLATCIVAGAAMPMHYAASTAIHELAAWVDGGPAPRSGPRFEFEGGALAKDEQGNTKGGIRLPPIDVPVARYESTLCQLGGITVPFLEPQLLALYPTHATYLGLMADRTDAAVTAGWLLPEDAGDLMRRACEARIRWLPPQAPCATYEPPVFRSAASPPAPGEPAVPPASPPSPPAPPEGSRLPATGTDGLALVGALLLTAALATRGPLRRAAP
jgi:hypothetical protein